MDVDQPCTTFKRNLGLFLLTECAHLRHIGRMSAGVPLEVIPQQVILFIDQVVPHNTLKKSQNYSVATQFSAKVQH